MPAKNTNTFATRLPNQQRKEQPFCIFPEKSKIEGNTKKQQIVKKLSEVHLLILHHLSIGLTAHLSIMRHSLSPGKSPTNVYHLISAKNFLHGLVMYSFLQSVTVRNRTVHWVKNKRMFHFSSHGLFLTCRAENEFSFGTQHDTKLNFIASVVFMNI